ncbi:endo-1,4-beta-xylanase [Leptolyngbya sp. 15MV]|nr:endo-1,4-beta-xylanase [Leptolyngbya sp. 15MV]
MRWADMEPTEGRYAFARTDKWIEWAVRTAKMPVHAGPLIDFSEICVPEWIYIWEHDYDTLRELVYEHIKSVVTRYRKTVSRWTVCSGLHVNESFAMTLERMMDLTRICALTVRKLQPGAKIQIEIARPWGEYVAGNKRSMPPRLYADMIQQAGVAIDALGLRLQMGQPMPGRGGRGTRDLMALSDLLDRYAEVDKPIAVTAVGVPSAPVPPGPASSRSGSAATEPAGFWRSPWSPSAQSAWAKEALRLIASKPYVVSLCWQDLYDLPPGIPAASPQDMPFGGLVTDQGQAKPVASVLAELRRTLRIGSA